jgi:hypothetical protein
MKKYSYFAILFFLLNINYLYAQSCDESIRPCISPNTSSSKTENLALDAVNQVKFAISTIENQIDGLRKKKPLLQLGKKILIVIFLVVFIWSVIKNMLLKPLPDQIVIDLIFPLIVLGLAYSMLDQNVGQLIVDSIDYLTYLLVDSVPGTDSSSAVFAENLLKSMVAIWSAPNPIDPFTLGIDTAISFLLKLVSIFFIATSIALGLSYLLLAKFQVSLAIVLAPVMIPWIMWKPTEFIFTSWLTFLLKSSFVSLCVFTIENMLRTSITNLVNLSDSVTQGVNSAFVYGTISLLSFLFSLLISKSFELGSSLISGNSTGLAKLSSFKV